MLDPNALPISTAPNGQQMPSVAYDGVNFLVAWDDARAVPFNPDIFGARVTASGTVLDPGGIPIAARSAIQAEPAVAFDQVNYLVVWHDGSAPTYDVFATRVTPGGGILDPTGFSISRVRQRAELRGDRLRRCELSRRLGGRTYRGGATTSQGCARGDLQPASVLDPGGTIT